MLYQDDFTDPATNWPEAKFDNYFIGYHEPEYYHVELNSANYKTTVFEPQKNSYGDATIELEVLTNSTRVDAQGPNFLFHINDELVGQATDPDYVSGEVGFYVESFDSAATHIHFDKLTIQNFKVSLLCNVSALTLNVRSGPSTSFSSIAVLSNAESIQPVGRSKNGEWMKTKVEGSESDGWVFNSPTFVTCNADSDLLPVVEP